MRLRCHHDSLSASVLVAAESYLARARGTYERIDRFVAPSRFLADVLVAGGLPGDRIDVVPNAVEVDAVPPVRRIERPPRLVYFGRYSPEKGLDDLLSAAGRLRAGSRVELFGTGPLEESLRRRVAAEHLPVDIHGHVPLAELRPRLAGAVAAVLPARWHENCPMSILEAGALGVATIGTALGGIPDLIEHDGDGLLVPPGDPAALARAMDALADDPARALEMGRAAHQRVHDRHRPEVHLDRLLRSYERAVDRVAGRTGPDAAGRLRAANPSVPATSAPSPAPVAGRRQERR